MFSISTPSEGGSAVKLAPHRILADLEDNTLSLQERFQRYLAAIGALPDDLARLEECEQAMAALAPQMKLHQAKGMSAGLRVGVLLALIEKHGYHVARAEGEGGDPLHRDHSKYLRQLLENHDTGSSRSTLSRLTRCGLLTLTLLERKLPTAEVPEPMKPLLPYGKKDYNKMADAVAELTQHGALPFPSKKAVLGFIKKKAEADGGTLPKDDAPEKQQDLIELDANEVRSTCELALKAINGTADAEAVEKAKLRTEKLLVQLRKAETRKAGEAKKAQAKAAKKAAALQKSLPSAETSPGEPKTGPNLGGAKRSGREPLHEGEVEEKGIADVPKSENVKADPAAASVPAPAEGIETHTAGILLVERHGCELRATLTQFNRPLFIAFKDYLRARWSRQTNWRMDRGIHCHGHTEGEGAQRCFCSDEETAKREAAALVAWASAAQAGAQQ